MSGSVRLRLSFKEWSRIVDQDPAALPLAREWLAHCERKIDEKADEFWQPFLHGIGEEAQSFKGLAPRYSAPDNQYGQSPGQKALVTFRQVNAGETDPP